MATTVKKAVDLEALQGLTSVFPTKDEVTEQISNAALGENITFATREEVIALFNTSAPEGAE